MEQAHLYPLKFGPIYQYRIWGGRRLANLLKKPLPPGELIGEAWILSDREDHPGKVINGKLKGQTISQILVHSPEQLLGKFAPYYKRFPLLLKFLDCKKVLSVQVHPSDQQTAYIPEGESGKTEAWVVLETGAEGIIYAGLKPGVTEAKLRVSLEKHKVADDLASFKPNAGDCVLIKAGTVHTLGDAVVFEIQENSDVTYRLYDWGRVDEKTGKPRDLQVEQAIACIDFTQTAIGPVKPVTEDDGSELRERIFDNGHFKLWRLTGTLPFMVGEEAAPRILVCIEGGGELESNNDLYTLDKGEVMLIPAVTGACPFVPRGKVVLLEIALPGNFNL
ncbi:MAG TPA: type I phosphomannose isomerase catalytic subunit [Mucilaginibacter sp.]